MVSGVIRDIWAANNRREGRRRINSRETLAATEGRGEREREGYKRRRRIKRRDEDFELLW